MLVITSLAYVDAESQKSGFQNWRKATEKFTIHDGSQFHREAKLKWMSRKQPAVSAQLSSKTASLQAIIRYGSLPK